MAKKSSDGVVEKDVQPLICSFCGKEGGDKRKLISGIGGVHICNQCAAVCDAELNDQPDEVFGDVSGTFNELADLLQTLTSELTVLTYKSIDDDDCIRLAEEMLPLNFQSLAMYESVKEVFRKKGWKDDSDIGAFWIPPFFSATKTTIGTVVWFAKDHKKKLSYLAFEKGGLEYVKNAKWLVAQNKDVFESAE
ncbi:MAG: hypothetical protein Pg6C_12960 [Treponemataceae bacterium]|nr:MAG: hypothetical protein Pg6C_12960 [Treponemataceae bacterium]